jgi:multidrug efflux pump subunit AcrA (membrane-fusion protein)
MPGVVLGGEITKIASIANTTNEWNGSGGDSVKKFDVEVTIEQREGLKLRPGISAKAIIAIDHLRDVVYVPLQSVVVDADTHACFVADGSGKAQRRVVTVGASNDNYVQIETGLEPAERVLLYNPSLGKQATESSGGESTAADAAGAPAAVGAAAADAAGNGAAAK